MTASVSPLLNTDHPEVTAMLRSFDTQRTEWEARYGEAERRHKMHTAQMEKFAAAEAEEAARPTSSSSSSNGASRSYESAGGSLASDAQLAALRVKLAGNA